MSNPLRAAKAYVLSLFAAIMSLMVMPAMAAIDPAVSTELASAKTDVLLIGGLVFGIAIAVALYKWFKRAL